MVFTATLIRYTPWRSCLVPEPAYRCIQTGVGEAGSGTEAEFCACIPLFHAVCSGRGVVITAAVFFGADAISVYAMKSPLSVYALQMLAPGLFLVAVMAVIRGYFQGLGSMMPTAVSQIIEQLIRAVISIAGASIFVDIGTRTGEKAGEELLGPAYGAAGGHTWNCAGCSDCSCLFDFLSFGHIEGR